VPVSGCVVARRFCIAGERTADLRYNDTFGTYRSHVAPWTPSFGTHDVELFGTPGRDFQASVHCCKQRPRSSTALVFVFGLIGFVFDLVKSPIAARSCPNINSLLILRLEQVFPSLASFGAFHAAPGCQMPPSRSGFSLTISKRPTTTVGHPDNGKRRDAFQLAPARATPRTFPLH
jgi:hypothetical protein